MIFTDKDIALRLIDDLELYLCESAAFEIVLNELAESQEWKERVRRVLSDPTFRAKVHATTLPLRQLVLEARDVTAAVTEMVRRC